MSARRRPLWTRAILVAALAYALALQGLLAGAAPDVHRHGALGERASLCAALADGPAPGGPDVSPDLCCLAACPSPALAALAPDRPALAAHPGPAALRLAGPESLPAPVRPPEKPAGARAPPPALA